MIALRIVLIMAAVVALDLGCLFFADPDMGWAPVSRAIGAQYDHPSPENQLPVEAALKEYDAARRPRLILVLLSVVLVTAGGVFMIVRELRRRRARILSKRHPVATPII
jgi:hypothetical protein